MKKLLWIFVLLLCVSAVFARDYTKIQEKEMKKSQKYGTTTKYLNQYNDASQNNKSTYQKAGNIKTPKILIIGDYKKIEKDKYNEKISSDDEQYAQIAKRFGVRNVDNYNAQAKGEDYYKLYRIAEKIIRANKLDYLNWRVAIYRDSENPNAYNTNLNYVAISTSLYDTFVDNDDALAFVIGHEMAHSLFGHQQRREQIYRKMKKFEKDYTSIGVATYAILKRKFLIESKNAEFAADVEGLKLAAKAGYNPDNSVELLTFFDSFDSQSDYRSDHPNTAKRIENYNTAKSLIPMKEWQEWGKYNIYNSDVLKVNASSDRASFVIVGAPTKPKDQYYHPETFEEYYLRCAYAKYLNSDFSKASEYFDKYFEINSSNAPAYIYAAYANQELYKKNNDTKIKNKALEYAKKAKSIDPKNKYADSVIKEIEE